MWFFRSPEIIFGEDSLDFLENLSIRRAFVVTDRNIEAGGLLQPVLERLAAIQTVVHVFNQVQPDPTVDVVHAGTHQLCVFSPDWIIAVGGGSVIDAAKGMWVLYERPDIDPTGIAPIEQLGLRKKCRMIAIPTTAGTGTEATWGLVLTDPVDGRKLGLGNRECLPDYAILDPRMTVGLPPQITADTGLDALAHAVEGFTTTWHNDFTDGLCLFALPQIFRYLPRAYRDGNNIEARQAMQNAATIAGLGFSNSMAALAHGMGHALGSVFQIPHGRAVALCLPYTIEYAATGEGNTRYQPLARVLDLASQSDEYYCAHALSSAIRKLENEVGQPVSLSGCGIMESEFSAKLDWLCELALNDSQTLLGTRVPGMDDLRRLFIYSFHGKSIDF